MNCKGLQFLRALTAAAAFAGLVLLTGCSKDKDKDDKKAADVPQAGIQEASRDHRLTFTDTVGNPIEGAKVLIGMSEGKPLPGNFLITDANGAVDAPVDWSQPQPITVAADGFVKTTFLRQWPGGQVFKIRKTEPVNRFELSGITTGFKVVDRDNKMEFAAVVPALSKQDMFVFDLNKFISPEVDQIIVMGKPVNIPSNLSIPKQTEVYFVPVTLQKLGYRMYFNTTGEKLVYTLKGQIPFREAIIHMQQKKPAYQLVNYFSIQGGSLKNIPITDSQNSADLPVNELTFNKPITVRAPAVKTGEVLIGAAVSQNQDILMPTDVKILTPGASSNLVTSMGSETLVATILTREAELAPGAGKGRISAAILPYQESNVPVILDLLNDPAVTLGSVKIQKIPSKAGITETGSFLLLSKIEKIPAQGGAREVTVLNRMWEVYGEGWIEQFDAPQFPNETTEKTGIYRWEVSLLGSNQGQRVELGQKMLDTATHATHVSVDF
jgi:hypothetical protein